MFKPVAFASGTLSATLSPTSNVMLVNAALYARLAEILGLDGDHHTYLQLGANSYGEMVKVTQVSDGLLTIARGQDGSEPKAFPFGAHVQYLFCASAAQDMLDMAVPPDIQIYGPDWLGITKEGPVTFRFEPDAYFRSDDGSVTFSGSFPNYDFSVNGTHFGLCSTPISGGQ